MEPVFPKVALAIPYLSRDDIRRIFFNMSLVEYVDNKFFYVENIKFAELFSNNFFTNFINLKPLKKVKDGDLVLFKEIYFISKKVSYDFFSPSIAEVIKQISKENLESVCAIEIDRQPIMEKNNIFFQLADDSGFYVGLVKLYKKWKK